MSFELKVDDRKLRAMLEAAVESDATAAVVVEGEAAKYAHVLNRGSAPGEKPWPEPKKKTTRGREGRIFSKQAPQGLVAQHAKAIFGFLIDALRRRLHGGKLPTDADVKAAANEAAEKTADVIREGAPVDSGKLKNSIAVRKAE